MEAVLLGFCFCWGLRVWSVVTTKNEKSIEQRRVQVSLSDFGRRYVRWSQRLLLR